MKVFEITRMHDYGAYVEDEIAGYVVCANEEEAQALAEQAGFKDEDNWFVDEVGECLGVKVPS